MSEHRIIKLICTLITTIQTISKLLQNGSSFPDDFKEKLISNRTFATDQLKFLKQSCPEDFSYAKLLLFGNIKHLFNQGDLQTAVQLESSNKCNKCTIDPTNCLCFPQSMDGVPYYICYQLNPNCPGQIIF